VVENSNPPESIQNNNPKGKARMKTALIAAVSVVTLLGSVYASDSNFNPIAASHANQNGIDNSNPNSALHGGSNSDKKDEKEKSITKIVYSYVTLTNYVTQTKTVTVTNVINVASCDAVKASEKKFFNLNSLPNDYYMGGKPRNFVSDGTYLYLSLSETSREVLKLNPDTGAILARYDVGSQPCGLAYTGGNYIFIALQREAAVVRLNTTTGKVDGRVTVPYSPLALAFDGTSLWTGSYEGTALVKINPLTLTVTGTYQGGFRPCDITCTGQYVFVANYGSNTVTKLDAKTGQVLGNFPTGRVQPYGITLDMDAQNIYVTHYNNTGMGSVVKMNLNGQILKTLDNIGRGAACITPFNKTSMLVSAQSSNELFLINDNGIIDSVKTGSAPWGVYWDGVNTWVANQLSGTISKR
jgi:YVTN family beta-propeller protein